MSQFFAPDVFPVVTPSPKAVLVLRALDAGDLAGADFFLQDVQNRHQEPLLAMQLQAALLVCSGDLETAYLTIVDALAGIDSIEAKAKLSFQAAVLSDALKQGEVALSHLEAALRYCPDYPLFRNFYARLVWLHRGVDAGRQAFASVCRPLSCLKPGEQSASAAVWGEWARLERNQGHNRFALERLTEALELFPTDPDLVNIVAACHLALQEFDKTLDVLASLPESFAHHPIVLCNRGSAYHGLGLFQNALQVYTEAATAAPEMKEAHLGLARAHFAMCEDAKSEAAAKQALELAPDDEDVLTILARALSRQKRDAEAIDCLKEGVARKPDSASLHHLLAVVSHEGSDFVTSEKAIKRAIELRPEVDYYHDLMGLLYLQHGAFAEAEKHFRIAINTVQEQTASYHSNYLFALHYNAELSAEEVFEAHCVYGDRFSGQQEDASSPLLNQPDPNRRLRIAYMSPDFRAHSVAFFMMPIIEGYDREQFEVFIYNGSLRRDDATDWFRDNCDQWRETHSRSFEDVHEMLVEDQIDILVDLAGHTGGNLLPIFGRRAAPVQVTYLGYPNTSGLPVMDYRLVDDVTDPPGLSDGLATEELVRLPDGFLCYRMIPDIEDVDDGPLSRGLPMTFGSFNNCMKLNDRVFDAWAEILHRLPDARLLLKSKYYSNPHAKDWVIKAFQTRGVELDRVDIRDYAPSLGAHLAMYGEMDLALDTFPYNGTTTTCEAISMGVPVLTVNGDRHSGRVGASLMTSLGLQDVFLAADVDEYVERAVQFAQERDGLAALRKTLRPRLLASPLSDESGFVAKLEAAYRGMWKTWCADGTRRYRLQPSPFEQDLRRPCEKN